MKPIDFHGLQSALVALAFPLWLAACSETGTSTGKPATNEVGADPQTHAVSSQQKEPAMSEKIIKTDEEWKKTLTPEQFQVARKKGTERAFTGQFWNSKEKGVYQCVCCGNDLFSSDTKFDSGTGWPSFWAPIGEANVHKESDNAYGM